jgi:hypothetical protein
MEKILAFVGGAKVVFLIPLPRYVLSGCCKNTEHVSNRLSGELTAEFAGAEKCLLEAATMGERTGRAKLINFFFNCFCVGRVPDPTSHFLPTSFLYVNLVAMGPVHLSPVTWPQALRY